MLYYIKNVTLFIIFNFANLLLLSALWIKKKFGDVGLESIYFTLKTPLDGVPNRVLFSYSKRIFFSILASLIMIFIIYYTLKKLKNKKLKHILTFAIPLTYCLVVTLIAINPYIDIIKYSRQNSTFIDQNYEMVMPEDVIAPLKKKNCIFILAESFENSFNGEQTDFNIIPKLKSIQDENISFKNQFQTVGTGYTVGALTGHIFGLPLILPFSEGSMYELFNQFLPSATSILEILEYYDYQINVIMGSEIKYAGKNKFFSQHSKNVTIFDSYFFLENNEKEEYKDNDNCYDKSFWDFCDLFVLDKAKYIVSELAKSDKPFFSLIVTADTHSPAKTFDNNPKVFNDARDAFISTDDIIYNFIDWLKVQVFYKDTIVIIIGDHEYMRNNVGDFVISNNIKRTLYNVFLNTEIDPQTIASERLCTTLDIAPTILEVLGFSIPKEQFGLGVSLFSKRQTLIEKYGLEYLNSELSKKSVLYESFFEEKS